MLPMVRVPVYKLITISTKYFNSTMPHLKKLSIDSRKKHRFVNEFSFEKGLIKPNCKLIQILRVH